VDTDDADADADGEIDSAPEDEMDIDPEYGDSLHQGASAVPPSVFALPGELSYQATC
jgi:hypothetical protein